MAEGHEDYEGVDLNKVEADDLEELMLDDDEVGVVDGMGYADEAQSRKDKEVEDEQFATDDVCGPEDLSDSEGESDEDRGEDDDGGEEENCDGDAGEFGSRKKYRVKRRRHGRRRRSRKSRKSQKSDDGGAVVKEEREVELEEENVIPTAEGNGESRRRKRRRRSSRKPKGDAGSGAEVAQQVTGAAAAPPIESDDDEWQEEAAAAGAVAPSEPSTAVSHVTGQHWEQLRKTFRQGAQMASVLEGWYPGVRGSTLAHIYELGHHRPSAHLIPALASHGLGYADLAVERNTGELRPVYSRSTFAVRLTTALGVPTPGNYAEILERKARICLFDGESILSNIHVVVATKDSQFSAEVGTTTRIREQWKFPRHGGFVPSSEEHDNVLVVRFPAPPSVEAASRMCLLVELAMVFVRRGEVDAAHPQGRIIESGEVSAGWTTLPLFPDRDGKLVDLSSYTLPLHGGSPQAPTTLISQQEIEAQRIPMWKVFSKRAGPKLKLKLGSLSRSHMHASGFLPSTFLASFSTLPLLVLFRQLLAARLLGPSGGAGEAGDSGEASRATAVSYDPVLTLFPMMLDEPDMIEWLEIMWAAKTRHMTKSERRSVGAAGPVFSTMISELWPLFYVHFLAPLGNPEPHVRRERLAFVEDFVQEPVARTALDPGAYNVYQPFHIEEVAFDPLANLGSA
ncbi:NPHP1 protein [Thecamonas trahens ATCC 50062]|uniref:NPHP1 protein n=1 Tax=Thecamonas trahens ATCC 50062 TaxID=461836 RepID=A0A0L0DQC2_THETB|nr:NPHP1 protein [Thecamonas trahens ATCC 50062]KNC53598.1 NPHP1 protein [Thecamonas trahens ATCC 50062]|eukprot:XP_013761915.1 NPHP1 protein [Thecamonas trahens ATCC 50062]